MKHLYLASERKTVIILHAQSVISAVYNDDEDS